MRVRKLCSEVDVGRNGLAEQQVLTDDTGLQPDHSSSKTSSYNRLRVDGLDAYSVSDGQFRQPRAVDQLLATSAAAV